jgi:hypothetical protein
MPQNQSVSTRSATETSPTAETIASNARVETPQLLHNTSNWAVISTAASKHRPRNAVGQGRSVAANPTDLRPVI